MRRRCTSAAILLALPALLCFAPALSAQADAPAGDRAEVQKKFDEAMQAMRAGNYDAAATALDAILKLEPTSHEALVMRERAGLAGLSQMLRRDDVLYKKFAIEIMRRAEKESERIDRSPAAIEKFVARLASEDVVTREDAIFRVSAIGSVAVPHLLDTMLSGNPLVVGIQKASALRALKMMGPTAIPPILAAVRNAEPDLATNLIAFLAEIPDARAVPVLCAIVDDPARPDFMKKVAQGALDELIPPPPPPPPPAPGQPAPAAAPAPKRPAAALAFYRLALRYYHRDPVLMYLLPSWERLIWSWNLEGKTLAERLKAEPNVAGGEKPMGASEYGRKLCRALLIEGMQLPHDQPDLIELYISNNFMSVIESEATDPKQAAADRRINESFGARYLYLSLGRALRERDEDRKNVKLAVQCISSLRSIGDPRPPAEENTLVAALDYPDKDVRALAAQALMEIYPTGRMGAPDRVIAATSAALGAQLKPVALVLTTDARFLGDVSAASDPLGIRIESRTEQVDVLNRLRSIGTPISVLLIDTRLKGISAVALVDNIRRDDRLAKLPIFLFAPKEDVAAVSKLAAGKTPVVCSIPLDTTEVAPLLTKTVSAPATPGAYDITANLKALAAMLTTLKDLPRETTYPVRDIIPAVVRLTTGTPAEIRILAFQVLAAQPDATARDAAYAVFVNAKEPADVRHEAGAALLRILPLRPAVAGDQIAAFRKATTESDAEIAVLANRMLAVADIPQDEREAALLAVIAPQTPKPAPAKPAKAKPAATTTTTAATTSAPAADASKPAPAKSAATPTTTKAPAPKPAAPKTPAPAAKPAGK